MTWAETVMSIAASMRPRGVYAQVKDCGTDGTVLLTWGSSCRPVQTPASVWVDPDTSLDLVEVYCRRALNRFCPTAGT